MSTILIPDFQEYTISLNPHNTMDGTRRLKVVTRETGQVSDGEQTFDELYRHRHLLFCGLLYHSNGYKSRLHHDGSSFDGCFIAGCDLFPGTIACHLPNSMWDLCPVRAIKYAPEWDGHTANDLVDRVETWLSQFAASTRQ